jgi:hypothetical protein
MESDIRERVAVAKQTFTFKLCRKAEQLGPVAVDHWWMRTTELYRQRAQRRRKGGNYQAVTESFWALCCQEGSHIERDVQESYLLARLLPYARSQGSRRIVDDAYLDRQTRGGREERKPSVKALNQLLQSARTESTTPLSFSRRTADVIGPPVLGPELIDTYQACCKELFDTAVTVMVADKEAAVAQMLACWQRLMRTVGRRRGRAVEKQVLDVLSYEARIALDRCYSAAWDMLLLPHLTDRYHLSPETVAFLRLWHLDQRVQPRGPGLLPPLSRPRLCPAPGNGLVPFHPGGAGAGRKLAGERLLETCLRPTAARHLDCRLPLCRPARRRSPATAEAAGGTRRE